MGVAAVGSANFNANLPNISVQASLMYLVAYAFTTLGAFAVVMVLEKADGRGSALDDFNGLYNTRPGMAIAMTIFMLSLTGIPLTAGFMGKWLVFNVTVQAGLIPLAIIGVLTSVVSAFYYLRIVVNMFLRPQADDAESTDPVAPISWSVYASMTAVMILGILPMLILNNLISVVTLV
jgi:NADH-quinone oxidoreductase subunit N